LGIEISRTAVLSIASTPGQDLPDRFLDDQGRVVCVDSQVRALIAAADGRVFAEVASERSDSVWAEAALAVLLAAGVLRASGDVARPSPPPERQSAPTNGPRVSLVIVNYNSGQDLRALLRSLATQTYENREVIVVDNASTDASVQGVDEHPEVSEVIRLHENVGFAAGFNVGVERATGAFIGVLNSDVTLADADSLAVWVASACERPEAAAIAPKMLLASHPAFLNGIGNSVLPDGWGSDNFMGIFDAGQFDHVQDVFSACFGAALLRRSALGQVGLPDPAYFLYYEDSDWCYRARLAGWTIAAAPACRVIHKFGGSVANEPSVTKLRLIVRNRLRFVLVNVGGRPLVVCLYNYITADVRSLVGALLRRRDFRAARAIGDAYLDLIRSARSLVRLRRSRRATRVAREPSWSLNVSLPCPASVAGEPLVSREVVDAYYVPLVAADGRADGSLRFG